MLQQFAVWLNSAIRGMLAVAGTVLDKQHTATSAQPVVQILPDLLSPIAVVLAAILAYFFGRRQTQHERLYTERARVIAEMFQRFEELDKRISDFVSPLPDVPWESGNKWDKGELAVESYNDLLRYYRTNSIWLSRGTAKLVGNFLERYFSTITEFTRYLSRREEREEGTKQEWSIHKWDEQWRRFEAEESPQIREALEEEFRAALGDRRARISRAWRSLKRLGGETQDTASKRGRRPWWRRLVGS